MKWSFFFKGILFFISSINIISSVTENLSTEETIAEEIDLDQNIDTKIDIDRIEDFLNKSIYKSLQKEKSKAAQFSSKKLNKSVQDDTKNMKADTKKDTDKSNSSDKKGKEEKIDKKDQENSKEEKKVLKKIPLSYLAEDSDYRFFFKLRLPEFFYGKNLNLLNNCNPSDRVIYFRHTLDLNVEYKYGMASRGYDVISGIMSMRTKGVWGDTNTIGFTTENDFRELDVVYGKHKHAIPRYFFWVRELWLQFSLPDLLDVPFQNMHKFSIGAFPFQLGRGIALGSSYAVDPTDLGFFSENAVDQYAWGAKFTGDIFKDSLAYDLYGSILDNQSAAFSNTSANIRGQQYGHRNYQERGFGIINYLLAGRFQWFPIKRDKMKTKLEPYGMYNHNPEQRVDVRGDAVSDLITLGVAAEFELGTIEFGFDTAYNFGHQKVYGIDRNIIKNENRNGSVVIVNSSVHQIADYDPNKTYLLDKTPLALKVPENQKIIDISTESAVENGRVIGSNSLGTLLNGYHRFRNPYKKTYRGKMAVFDISYYLQKDLRFSWAIGYSSGDENPHKDLYKHADNERDSVYEGFIGIEETYSGTRVRSSFLLSGSGRIPRLLAFPATDQVRNLFPTTVTRFTNLYFVGGCVKWSPVDNQQKWNFNPNFLIYWQDMPTKLKPKFPGDIHYANPFLGTEVNCFTEAILLPDLRFFSIGSVFIPGEHYKEIKGIPINKEQQKFLDNRDKTGINNNFVPFLGDDVAIFINFGLEYRF